VSAKRQTRRAAASVCLALAPLLVHCAGAADTQRQPVTPTSALQPKVDWALQDAAKRTRVDAARLRVTLAEAVTWPDAALGCPEPGREYGQVLVSGYRIRITAGSETLEYHGSFKGQPFFCPAARIQPPTTTDPRT
jgi:hypothetical protein